MVSTPLNNVSQWGWLFQIHGKIKMFQTTNITINHYKSIIDHHHPTINHYKPDFSLRRKDVCPQCISVPRVSVQLTSHAQGRFQLRSISPPPGQIFTQEPHVETWWIKKLEKTMKNMCRTGSGLQDQGLEIGKQGRKGSWRKAKQKDCQIIRRGSTTCVAEDSWVKRTHIPAQ